MKIYIASSFSLIPKVEYACKILEDAEHEVLVKWWTRLDLKKKFAPLNPEAFYSEPECANAYERDFNGVMECDVFLFVADDKPRAYNGANVELGIALGNSKRCLSIGRLANSALYWPVYRCKDMDEVLAVLDLAEKHGIFKNSEFLTKDENHE